VKVKIINAITECIHTMHNAESRQRLPLLFLEFRILIIFPIFFSIVFVAVISGIPIQANAKKITTMPTSLPWSLNDNGVLNDQAIGNNNSSNNSSSVNISSTVANHNNNNGTHPSYLIYENPADNITITYPYNWQKIEYPPGAMNYGVGHRIIANFLAPLSSSDNWRGSMTVQISSQSDLKNIIPQNATATVTKLGDHRAFKLEYTSNEIMYLNSNLSKFNTINLKIMQVWTTIGDNTYLLTYSADASKYQQYLPVIQRMLNSFKVS
jgi:hypothetical protein